MKESIPVSVIIPFYKNKSWLVEALESINAQTVTPYEVIVINDGCIENISDLKEYYSNLQIIEQENSGPGGARNHGILSAQGDYIAFLDSDDLWHSKKLEIQYKLLKQSGLEWSYTDFAYFNDKTDVYNQEIHEEAYKKIFYPKILKTCDIGTPCVMVKRSVLLDNKLFFAKDLKYGEDYYLWIELASRWEVLYIVDKLSFVRLHGDNAAKNACIQLKARVDIYKKIERKKVPVFIRINYRLCEIGLHLTKILSFNYHIPLLTKMWSAIFYIIPWLLFKI